MSYPAQPPPYSATPQQGVPMVNLQPQPAQMVPIVIPTIVEQPMGPQPTITVCKSCNCQIVTRVDTSPTLRTHLWALCLFVVGLWPCACIPYCTPACMNVSHYCPNCNAYVGRYYN